MYPSPRGLTWAVKADALGPLFLFQVRVLSTYLPQSLTVISAALLPPEAGRYEPKTQIDELWLEESKRKETVQGKHSGLYFFPRH